MGRSTQARAGPSQRQSQPSQTQNGRSRRAAARQQQESEDEAPDGTQQQDEDDGMDVDDGKAEIVRKADDLVRLALFTEQRRMPLKRDDINKKVIGQGTRSFNAVFEAAQVKLRTAFGMELVELPSRAGIEHDAAGDDANEGGRPATGMKKRAAPTGLKQYILRSTLDPALIEAAMRTDDDLAAVEKEDYAVLFPLQALHAAEEQDIHEGEDPEDERPARGYGSILNWSRADQLAPTGILYVILALVLVSGRTIPDNELRRHLKNLGLSSNPTTHPVYHTTAATARALTLDAYFTQLMKQGYLSRDEVGGDAAMKKKGRGGGAKRVRAQADDAEEGRQYEWRWGPRAFCEVGEENIATFIAEFMVGDGNEDDNDGAAQGNLIKKMYQGVEKAAGGSLTEIK